MIKKKLVKEIPTQTGRPKSQPLGKEYEDDEDISSEAEVDTDDDSDNEEQETPRSANRSKVAGQSKVSGTSSSGSKKSSLASKFDAIASSSSSNAQDIPKGKYEAIISEAILQEPDAKGQSVRMKLELCDPDYSERNQITQWFKILDADGEPFEVGVRMLTQALAKLGYKLTFDDIEEILGEISKERPGVIINVSYSEGKKDGRIFQNALIENTCDNEVVQEYKDNVVY